MIKKLVMWFSPKRNPRLNQILSTTFDKETGKAIQTLYSPYSEFEYLHEDGKLSIHLFSTFGLERVPNGTPLKKVFNWTIRKWLRNNLTPLVGEVHLSNHGNNFIYVKLISLTMSGETIVFNNFYEIHSSVIVMAKPLITISSSLATEIEITLSFEYEDEIKEIKGMAKRVTVKEAKSKYQQINT